MAGVTEVRCGDLAEHSLERIWKDSATCQALRNATVEQKPICRTCSLKCLCGGGDIEHGYWSAVQAGDGDAGRFLGHDPYCDLYKGLAHDALTDLAREGPSQCAAALRIRTARGLPRNGRAHAA